MNHDGFETEEDIAGFGVYSGCEGDCPVFVAFVTEEVYAQVLCEARTPDGELLIFDSGWQPAVLERAHIGNSMEIRTADDIRNRLRS